MILQSMAPGSLLVLPLLIAAVSSQEVSSSKHDEEPNDDLDISWELVQEYRRTSGTCQWQQEIVQVRLNPTKWG